MKAYLLIMLSALLCGPLAFAKTPDGLTPAEETVCDEAGYKGKAWGLCNAYCEAMDCDSAEPHASDKACEAVFKNWLKAVDGEDILPCPSEPECPELEIGEEPELGCDDFYD